MKVAKRTQMRAQSAFAAQHSLAATAAQTLLKKAQSAQPFAQKPATSSELEHHFAKMQDRAGRDAYHWVLEGKVARPACSFEEFNEHLMAWITSDGTGPWRVAKTPLPNGGEVSTVFLGLNHDFFGGAPKIFETMTFYGDYNDQRRYSTWEEAEAGHREAVERHMHAAKAVRKLKDSE